MKKPLLVLLKGKPTAGKSTAFRSLRYDARIKKDFIFVDHENLKSVMGKEEGKMALFDILRTIMKNRPNIMTEEMSGKTIMKYLGKEIKKYDYEIITFYFEIDIDKAHKRNKQRAKTGWHSLMEKQKLEEMHRYHIEEHKDDINPIIVDCNKLNKKQVIELIAKKLA